MCRNANRHRIPAPSYRPGQQVMLLTKDLSLQVPSRKLAPRYVGPFAILSIINPVSVKLALPPSVKRHPVVHVSQIKPVAESALSPPAPAPPPSRFLANGDQVWTVKEILRVRRQGRGLVYLVDWEGYGPEDRSWVPASYLADPSLLEDFYRANPDAPRRSSGASHKGWGTVMTRSRTHVSSAVGAAGTSLNPSASSTLRQASARAEHNTPTQQQACKQLLISAPGLDEGEQHKDQRT
nr:uncharacterized protein LOC133570620 [Nerophis lumbriciformis]XP_061820711.1 uncharacterized protein LOC133609218 [Nerophis lumbriciformis]